MRWDGMPTETPTIPRASEPSSQPHARPTEYHWIGIRADGTPVTGTSPIENFITIRDNCMEMLQSSHGAVWDVLVIHILDANGHLVWSQKRAVSG